MDSNCKSKIVIYCLKLIIKIVKYKNIKKNKKINIYIKYKPLDSTLDRKDTQMVQHYMDRMKDNIQRMKE